MGRRRMPFVTLKITGRRYYQRPEGILRIQAAEGTWFEPLAARLPQLVRLKDFHVAQRYKIDATPAYLARLGVKVMDDHEALIPDEPMPLVRRSAATHISPFTIKTPIPLNIIAYNKAAVKGREGKKPFRGGKKR